MTISRIGNASLAILALGACGYAFAGVAEPSAQTLCNAIGSEISVPRDAETAATKPKARGTQGVKPARAPGTAAGGSSRGGGGDAALERRGRWKSFLPGTFK